MPLVRVDLQKGKDAAYRRKVGQIVYEAMVACTGVPKNDHFQVISEHTADNSSSIRTISAFTVQTT